MTTTVAGIFSDLATADTAVTRLVADGTPRPQVSVIVKNTPHHEQLVLEETNDAPRGIVTGALGGGVLFSLAFAALALPGVGIIAAGPLLAAIGAGSAGAVAGGLIGTMIGHGVSTSAAQAYETAIANGKVLVAVHTRHDRAKAISHLLRDAGAASVSDYVHFTHEHGAGGE